MAAREKKIDMIIMGWHGANSYRKSFIFGSTLDPVVEKAPCHVVVFKDCPNEEYKRILVPFAGGPNGALAFEIASILAAPGDGQIVPLNVARPGQPTQDIEAFLDEAVEEHQLNRFLFHPKYLVSKNFVEAIIGEANEWDYDLVIIGATRDKILKQLIRGSLPEEIARRIQKPLVMVNATGGFKLFMRRII